MQNLYIIFIDLPSGIGMDDAPCRQSEYLGPISIFNMQRRLIKLSSDSFNAIYLLSKLYWQ